MSDESASTSACQEHQQELPSKQLAFCLLDTCDRIRSSLGRRLTREHEERREVECSPLNGLPADQRNTVVKAALTQILEEFAEAIGQEAVDGVVRVQGNTPADARDAVLSWVELIAPLVDRSHVSSSQRYTPRDFSEALRAIEHSALQSALWAPDRARADKDRRGLAVDRVMALGLARSLIRAGHNLHLVHKKVATAFGSNWETMRKWEGIARRELGDERVDMMLEAAESGQLFPSAKNWVFAEVFIQQAGTAYKKRRGEKTLQELGHARELEQLLWSSSDNTDEIEPATQQRTDSA